MTVTEQYGTKYIAIEKLCHACKQELNIQFYKHRMLSCPHSVGHQRVLESVDENCSLSVLWESF